MSGDGKSNGIGGKPVDPFATGVWVLAMVGDRDVLARVVGNDTEDDLRAEMVQFRSICVTLMPRYILAHVRFPLPQCDAAGNRTGAVIPANVLCVGRHEMFLELEHDFPMHACLTTLAFIGDLHPNDIERMRKSVWVADEVAETTTRMMRSNLIAPMGGGIAQR